MSEEFAPTYSYRFHLSSGAAWVPMRTGYSSNLLTLPDGSELLFPSRPPSNISDFDKTELVRQTQLLYCVLLELTGARTAADKCKAYLQALQSTTDSSHPEWKAIAHSTTYHPVAGPYKILEALDSMTWDHHQLTPPPPPSGSFNFVPPSLISPDDEET